ncbi:hypothetical protein, partial [Lactobacillus helveticus]|uniref:hypothetical protein n=1 Tax=Lactobacillus helveticus TaxID=1587 RepID=UPI001D127965
AKRSGLKSNLGTQKPEPIRVPVSFSAFKFQLNTIYAVVFTNSALIQQFFVVLFQATIFFIHIRT